MDKLTFANTLLKLLVCWLLTSLALAFAESTTLRVPSNIDGLPSLSEDDERNALAVAFDCLGSLSLHTRKVPGALERAQADGQLLLKLGTVDERGRFGWPYRPEVNVHTQKCGRPGSLESFAGPCNPPDTPYMIQTGYAVTCLAQLSLVADDGGRFLKAAERAIGDSWDLGTRPSACKSCYYYWYGYNQNDYNRYVRNTNLIMGLGLAWLYTATGVPKYRERALAIASAEHREITAQNFGYYGIDDQRHQIDGALEHRRIENHIPHQVKALKDIGKLLGDQRALDDAKQMLDAYITCASPQCRPNNCKDWAVPIQCKHTMTVAPCILSDLDDDSKSQCIRVMRALSRLNAFQVFLSASSSDSNKFWRK